MCITYEMVFLGKRFPTFRANKRTLPGMVFAMCHEMSFRRKRPVAFRTSEGLLSTVYLKFMLNKRSHSTKITE